MSLKNRKGFTLIEIVIVLAIAALILVIVFLAVNGAQVARRNDGRKDVTNRALAGFTAWQSNHNGTNPTTLQLQAQIPAAERTVSGIGAIDVQVGAAPSCTGAGGTVAIVTAGTPTVARICLENDSTAYAVQ